MVSLSYSSQLIADGIPNAVYDITEALLTKLSRATSMYFYGSLQVIDAQMEE
jgi:hypothetical protein